MELLIKNIEYFEWQVPDDLVYLMRDKTMSEQDLIDEYFDPDSTSVSKVTDDYYELE